MYIWEGKDQSLLQLLIDILYVNFDTSWFWFVLKAQKPQKFGLGTPKVDVPTLFFGADPSPSLSDLGIFGTFFNQLGTFLFTTLFGLKLILIWDVEIWKHTNVGLKNKDQ